MRWEARVEVRRRSGISDPEAATIERSLPALGYGDVHGLTSGRWFRFEVEAEDEASARQRVAGLADRLLANPVIEETALDVSPARGR
jgi:phosphoribosylformylglycinamidine synthase subunit PurS